MSGLSLEHARLLPAPSRVSAELARNLLSAAGIPSMLHGQDRGGYLRTLCGPLLFESVRQDLYVPRREYVRARNLLVEAWGEEDVLELEGRADEPGMGGRLRWQSIAVFGLSALLVAVACWLVA